MEEIVEKEMEAYRSTYCPTIENYLNNFILHLPDNRFKNGGYYRRYYNSTQWVTKFKDMPRHIDKGHSDLFMNQSPKEFYETIDKTIVDCGLSLEEIRELWKKDEKMKLWELSLPIYIRLRELGYNKNPDLTR